MTNRSVIGFSLGLVLALALGWVVLPKLVYRSLEQPLQFSHKVHTGESVGLSCETCHTFAADGQFSGIPPLAKCAECHSEQLGKTDAEHVLVEQYVKLNKELPWSVYARQPQNAYFSHAAHVTLASITCDRCHADHGSLDALPPLEQDRFTGYGRDLEGMWTGGTIGGKVKGLNMDACADCHTEHGVTNSCLKCHK